MSICSRQTVSLYISGGDFSLTLSAGYTVAAGGDK